MQLAKGKLPDAPLFDGVDYWDAIASHRSTLKALGLPKDYTLHDARHSFAVRWMRAGIDPNLIAATSGTRTRCSCSRCTGSTARVRSISRGSIWRSLVAVLVTAPHRPPSRR